MVAPHSRQKGRVEKGEFTYRAAPASRAEYPAPVCECDVDVVVLFHAPEVGVELDGDAPRAGCSEDCVAPVDLARPRAGRLNDPPRLRAERLAAAMKN